MDALLDSAGVIARLRMIRQARRLSAEDLSRRTGIRRSVIANLENGRRRSINVDELAVMCAALDVDPREVITAKPMTISTETTEV